MTGALAQSDEAEVQSVRGEVQFARGEILFSRAQSNNDLRRDHSAGFDMARFSLRVVVDSLTLDNGLA